MDRQDASGSHRTGLDAIGWSPVWAAAFESIAPSLAGDGPPPVAGRVVEEQRGVLRCRIATGEVAADVSGRLRYLAAGPEELPGVGDWVALALRPEEGRGTVHAVLPRRSALVRKSPGEPTRGQLLAANVDRVLVAAALDQALRARRIERTLALAREGGAAGVVVLTKLDCVEPGRRAALLDEATRAAGGCPVVALSGHTGEGVDALHAHVGAGHSVALLGPSGVGKSTLANRLLGADVMATQEIREGDHKGRHTTTHRQLFALPGGGALIDTPGLREVGLWDDGGGIDSAFPEIEALQGRCRFADCGHGGEPGCAVEAALADGRIAPERWQHYGKLKREAAANEERRTARGRHEARKRNRAFAKRIRNRPDKRRPGR